MKVYINPIVLGILVSLIILYFAIIPMLVYQYRKYGTFRMNANIVFASFIVYMITAWFMTILPLPPIEAVRSMKPIHPNFRPFLFIDSFLRTSGFILTKPATWLTAMGSSSFFTVAFNVVLTIPFGVYLRRYFKLRFHWVILLGFLLSLFYETTQYTGLYGIYPRAYRFADVDDLIVNTLGAAIGYFFTGLIGRLLPDIAKDQSIISDKATLFRRLLSLIIDYVAVNILYQISRVTIYWNNAHREWDLAIFMTSAAVVFILLPLLTRKRQTPGMLTLSLYLVDKNRHNVKTSKAILHNSLVGIWLCFYLESRGSLSGLAFTEFISDVLLSIWLIILVIQSLRQKQISYFWEPWLDSYLKVYIEPDMATNQQAKITAN